MHIIIETEGKIPFWEGQSYGVIPPGEDRVFFSSPSVFPGLFFLSLLFPPSLAHPLSLSFSLSVKKKTPKLSNKTGTKINSKGKEVRHGVRLYSIAASRYGDEFDGKTTSLCVRRATYWCPELKADDPAKKGLCSNFLCDAKPGDEIEMTGPTGKILLMPEDPNAVLIMVATWTGIAPFRSFWRRCFLEDVPNYRFGGLAWLFMGVANSDAKLYDDELSEVLATYPDQFRLDYALSREQSNAKGGKMYIQDKVEEYADEVFDLLNNGAHIYFCGLKGMMPGIQEMLERVSKEKGLVWEEFFAKLKKNEQWHVEVY